MLIVHGSCVAIDGKAVLLRGPSGAGKSDLALRLIDGGARLVADDQIELELASGGLIATPPAIIAGLIEVRGLGLHRIGHLARIPLALVVDLKDSAEIERLPEPDQAAYLGVSVPLIALFAREASAPAKVRLAMHAIRGDIMRLP